MHTSFVVYWIYLFHKSSSRICKYANVQRHCPLMRLNTKSEMRAQSLKTYCLSGFIVCVISSKFENLCARITFAISFLSYFTIGSWSISPRVSSGKAVNEMTVLVSLSITACLNTFQNFKKLSVDLSVVTCLLVVLEILLVFFVVSDLLVLAELGTVLLLQENMATDNPKNTVEMWRNCFMRNWLLKLALKTKQA